MKVLMLKSYFYPENCAGITLTQDLIDGLISNGYEVMVYTPTPCRGISKEKCKKYKKLKNEKYFDGKLVIKRYSLFPESKVIAFRFLRYMLQNIIQIFKGIMCKSDILCLSSTPPTMGIVGTIIKKVKRVPFIYIVQDIFPDSLLTSNILSKKSFIYDIGNALTKYSYKNADYIIVISEDFRKNLINKGVPRNKIIVIPNWVDEKKIIPISKKNNPFFRKFNIDSSTFNVVYAGNLGQVQDLEILLDAALKLKDNKNINFIIFGTGNQENKLKSIKEKKQLENVHFFPLQDSKYLSYIYGLSDVSIVSCKKGAGNNAMPSKTWSIMSSGKPILAIFDKESELYNIIHKYNIGFFSEAGNTEMLVENLLFLSKNRDICSKYGNNARKYIELYLTKKTNVEKYIRVFDRIRKNKNM